MVEEKVEMTKEEQIGFHKGAITTLLAERNELLRLADITNKLISSHVQALESLGVKVTQEKEEKKND